MRRAHARGQGMVEAALGIFVFVTVLVFGIHFAEVSHLSLKVQEAANTAMWDSTSRKMHNTFAKDWNGYKDAVSFAQANAQGRYDDFDGLATKATTVTQVFTTATDMTVACEELAVGHGLLPLAPDPKAALAYPSGMSGIACRAQATIAGIRIPRGFADNSLSDFRHWRRVEIRACAVGRPVGGNCPGQIGMMLDDWGYSGPDEAQECPLSREGGTTCANQGYYDQVSTVYKKTALAGAASKLAQSAAGVSPIDEDFFYMSFRGMESSEGPFRESVNTSHGDIIWETTPWANPRSRADFPRTNCWLGKNCP
jgi:hypothetical protein